MSRLTPGDNSGGEPLGAIFEWAPEKHTAWALLPPLVLSGLVLFCLSILFDVSTPVAERPPTMNRQLIHLDPNHPSSAMALSRARDRSSLILPSVGDTMTMDRSLLPTFQPSFQGFQLELREMTTNRLEVPSPRLFRPDDIALEPLAARPPPESVPPSTVAYQLEPIFHDDLAAVEMKVPPDLQSLTPLDAMRLRLHLDVQPSGQILAALPLSSGEEAEFLNELHDRLMRMRFQPSADPGIRKGIVSFRWQPVPLPR